MDKQTENVEFFFERLREQPAMSVAELEKIVASRKESEAKRPFVIWGAVGMLALVMGSGALLMDQGTTPAPSKAMVATATEQPIPDAPESNSVAMNLDQDSANDAARSELARVGQPASFDRSKPSSKKGEVIPRRLDINLNSSSLQTSGDVTPDISNDEVQTMAFSGSKLIELTKKELAAMGVRVSEERRVECYQQYKQVLPGRMTTSYADVLGDTTAVSKEGRDWVWSADPSIRKVYRSVVVDSTYDTYMEEPINESLEISYPTFSPSHATDLQGKRWSSRLRGDMRDIANPWSWESMLQISNAIDTMEAKRWFGDPHYVSRLIPIRVRTESEQKDVILWYHPQVEVLGALPHRVQLQLRGEMESIEAGMPTGDTALKNYRTWISRTRYELDSILAARQPDVSTTTEDPAVTGSCYLSFCTISSGGINGAPIFPNPAHDVVTVGYKLMGRRTVTITLHDINGAQVRQLVAPHVKDAGRWTMQGSLVGVKPGIYLVVVSTEKREQVVQRVIVE